MVKPEDKTNHINKLSKNFIDELETLCNKHAFGPSYFFAIK